MGRIERRQQKKASNKLWQWLYTKGWMKKILAAAVASALLVLLVLNILIWTSDVSKLDTPAPQPTLIYDQNGNVASKISASNIEGVTIQQIPKHMVHAVIATEDQRFYKHGGINYFGILKAMIQNTLSGEIVAGGSTITQQLAKNAFLTQERTYTRKFKELILTKKIERTYSKDEIMEKYLNQIYFGEGAWGIQRAAQTYFGKDASELTLSESATLAGLIKAPSILSPFKNYDKALERRNLVLSLMKNEGYIRAADAEKAKAQSIALADKKSDKYKGKHPYYVGHVIDEAINQYKLTQNEVLSGGLHIYTELNANMQANVEAVYKNDSLFPKSAPDQLVQSSAVFINPATGGIQALIGGRGEYENNSFNRATQLKRQPGSAMKPLAVYTPALERGYDVFSNLSDNPININGYQPQNYDKQFRGEVSMYDAVIQSYNVPAVWLLQKIGLENGAASVERFGIPLAEKDHIPGLALGGMIEGTSPLKMAQAFSAFPNNGVMREAHAIRRIEDADRNIIAKWKKKETLVTKPAVAQKITFMLKGGVEQGTGRNARIGGRELAGKTGTTQHPLAYINGAKDHWFVGYTPQIVGAVWIGYDKTDEQHYLSSSSGETTSIIFKQIISQSAKELPEKEFDLALLGDKYEKQLEKRKKEAELKKKFEEMKKKLEEKLRKKDDEEGIEDQKEEQEKGKDKNKDKGKKNKDDEDNDDKGDDD
ncbi:MAG: transglycosylase domain-containing protein [Ectobacillus sp.]